MSDTESKASETLRFEDALARLEELVDVMDAGELDLEESLQKFEEGVRLVRFCSDRLDAARLRLDALDPERADDADRADGGEDECPT